MNFKVFVMNLRKKSTVESRQCPLKVYNVELS